MDELKDDEEYEEILEDMREESGKFGKSTFYLCTILLSACEFFLFFFGKQKHSCPILTRFFPFLESFQVHWSMLLFLGLVQQER